VNKKLIKTHEILQGKSQNALSSLLVLQDVLRQLSISRTCVCYAMIGEEFTGTLQQVIFDIKNVNDTLLTLLSEEYTIMD